jgi:acetolactate decarboxylase
MTFKITLLRLLMLLLFSDIALCSGIATAQRKNEVKIVGEMKNVMRKGQLYGTIHLDTIASKKHLYGMGPVEYLTGEVLIIDGKSYKSTVVNDIAMKVEATYDIKSPFFGYTNISKWTTLALPDSILSFQQLEAYLDKLTKSSQRPFFFKLAGTVTQATIHIVNLPKDTKVSSPEEAHHGKVNYKLTNETCDIIGFFSTEHKTIFTHQSTFLHMHLITSDRLKMGHLDEVAFKKGSITLYLPAE